MCVAMALLVATAVTSLQPAEAAEARATLESRFVRMDRDGNGYVQANEAPRLSRTRCEAGDASPAQPASWVDGFDRDGDARVSLQEYLESALPPHVATATPARRQN